MTEQKNSLSEKSEHKLLSFTLTCIKAGTNPLLVGPSGCGKTSIARQIAERLNIPFYFIGAVTSAFMLRGFRDAHGNVEETSFVKAYKNGGLFLFDELDASDPAELVAVHAALDNGLFDTPAGLINRHPDFYFIAAANTWGNGATLDYMGRNHLDGATLDRFITIPMDYDEAFERNLVAEKHPDQKMWSEIVIAARAATQKLGIRHTISIRAHLQGAKLLDAGINLEKVKECVLWRGLAEDTKVKLENEMNRKIQEENERLRREQEEEKRKQALKEEAERKRQEKIKAMELKRQKEILEEAQAEEERKRQEDIARKQKEVLDEFQAAAQESAEPVRLPLSESMPSKLSEASEHKTSFSQFLSEELIETAKYFLREEGYPFMEGNPVVVLAQMSRPCERADPTNLWRTVRVQNNLLLKFSERIEKEKNGLLSFDADDFFRLDSANNRKNIASGENDQIKAMMNFLKETKKKFDRRSFEIIDRNGRKPLEAMKRRGFLRTFLDPVYWANDIPLLDYLSETEKDEKILAAIEDCRRKIAPKGQTPDPAQVLTSSGKSYSPGQLIEGKGIYIGLWEPVDRDGISLGKTFHVFAAPTDLDPPDSSGKNCRMFMAAARELGNRRNWHGHDGFFCENDTTLYGALEDGTVIGKWFIPTRDLLHGKDIDGNVVRNTHLFSLLNEGAFKGTFITEDKEYSNKANRYWSCTERRDDSTYVWLVRFSDGDDGWDYKGGHRLSCRPCRVELAL